MTKKSSFLIGVGLVSVCDLVWFVSLQQQWFSEILLVVLGGGPILAGSLTAFLAPRNNIMVGSMISIPTTVLIVLMNTVNQAIGKGSDFPGFVGGTYLALVYLLLSLTGCSIAAVFGLLLRRVTKFGLYPQR